MSQRIEERLSGCLYFSTQDLARRLASMADTAWRPTGLSPSHGYTLFLIIQNPETNFVWVAEQMRLAPSTITRFVDKLEAKGLVKRTQKGRNILLEATNAGKEMEPLLEKASCTLYEIMIDTFGESTYLSARDSIINLTDIIRRKHS